MKKASKKITLSIKHVGKILTSASFFDVCCKKRKVTRIWAERGTEAKKFLMSLKLAPHLLRLMPLTLGLVHTMRYNALSKKVWTQLRYTQRMLENGYMIQSSKIFSDICNNYCDTLTNLHKILTDYTPFRNHFVDR